MSVVDALTAEKFSRAAGIPRKGAASGSELKHRLFDIIVIAVVALAFLPLMLLIALAVSAQDGGPVVFAHRRIGRNGRVFRCWKFRSMVVDAEERLQRLLDTDEDARRQWDRDHKLKIDPRITPLGRFLRASSLDELPQVFNVLAGDMSVVGPRPIVQAEVSRYGRRFEDYCRVRPGITGLWQVSGRNDVTYRRRVALDSVYARSKSVAGDMKILVRTIPAVLMRRGSY